MVFATTCLATKLLRTGSISNIKDIVSAMSFGLGKTRMKDGKDKQGLSWHLYMDCPWPAFFLKYLLVLSPVSKNLSGYPPIPYL